MSEASRVTWERRTERPLIVAALIFLIAYGWPIIDPNLPGWATTLCNWVTYVVWAIFVVDYLVRLVLAENRWRFVRRNWIDVVILALPMLRPLRALRAVLAINLVARRSHFVRGQVVAYVGGAVGIVLVVAALAVLDAERRSPAANIRTLGMRCGGARPP